MKLRVTKIGMPAEAQFPSGNWSTYRSGRMPAVAVSLPLGYTIEGELLRAIEVGHPAVLWRTRRNGVSAQGIFTTTPVVEVTDGMFRTHNSVYRVETMKAKPNSPDLDTGRKPEPPASGPRELTPAEIDQWVDRFVRSTDPQEANALEVAILEGYYGRPIRELDVERKTARHVEREVRLFRAAVASGLFVSREAAWVWFNRPQPDLGSRRPAQLCATAAGAREVEVLLQRTKRANGQRH